jgi:Ribonuclease G/E
LTNPESENRAKYYGKQIEGTPAIFFNGKSAAGGGGPRDAAMEKFKEYKSVVEPLLEKSSAASLLASAKKVGEDVSIAVEVKDLTEIGNNIRLNMVLVEKEVRYQGGNKQKKHHHVVRSFPAGVDGIAMMEKNGKKEAKVNLEELRKKWASYLDQVAKEEPFSGKGRPLNFTDLLVVVFIQNMATGEILQSTQVPVN